MRFPCAVYALLLGALTTLNAECQVQGSMSTSYAPDSRVARAALLVMRASLPNGQRVEPNRVVIRPDAAVLTDAQAAAVLVARAPLRCEASNVGGNLVVTCSPMTEHYEQGLRWLNREVPITTGIGKDESGGVLLIGRSESMILQSNELRSLWDNIDVVVQGLAFSGREPTKAEADDQVNWVLHVGVARPVSIEEARRTFPFLRRDPTDRPRP